MVVENYEQEKQALEQVLLSGIFERSPSLAQVLTYVCGRYFDGTSEGVKEYSIAIDALGRAADFDQKKDSIVRVQVHRLRERLVEYYETAGSSSEIRIEIPQGQYVPRFVRRATAELAEGNTRYQVSTMAAVDTESFTARPINEGGPRTESDKADFAAAMRPTPPIQESPSNGVSLPPGETAAPRTDSYWPPLSWLRVSAILLAAAVIAGIGWTVDSGRETAKAGSPSLPTSAFPAVVPGDSVRILAGLENGTYTDGLGRVWQADRYFTGGSVVKTPGHMILGTREPRLYEARRQGMFSYDIPLKPGVYELRLHFAEVLFGDLAGMGGEGSRAFAINVNGKQLTARLDVIGEAGTSTAHIRAYRDIEPAPDGMLHLSFDPIASIPFINAIEITPGIRGKMAPVRIITQDRAYRDSQGREWEPDLYAIGGQMVKRAPLAGAPDPQFFAGERFGNIHYSIPVPPGKYSVTFYMAERWLSPDHPGGGGPGSRVFDVLCNGVALVRDFDVLKRAGGPDKALVQTFHGLEPNHQGKLDLWLVPNKNFPLLNALEILDESR
jgi:hypothetical protein